MSVLQQYMASHLAECCQQENLSPALVHNAIAEGRMVLLGNPAHAHVRPVLIGQPARVKVNANIGTSPLCSCLEGELHKMRTALAAGADTVMDLSVAGDVDSIRQQILSQCSVPVGTVPIYAVGQQLLDNDKHIADMTPAMLFDEIAKQARQGVDYMTLHCGITQRGAALATAAQGGRCMGIVSRGGAMLARWMRENGRENPLLDYFDTLLEICREHTVTISLGDALRSGAGADAGDAAQWEEVVTLGGLAVRARQAGVQVMIEGPGHVPLLEVASQIRAIKRATHFAPLYVLGPLTVDSAAGHDHIAGAIGAALAVCAGVDYLCYLTPAEHLTLPETTDVYAGVMASRVAAHAGEVALGREHAVEREKHMNTARKKLDWAGMEKAALDPETVRQRRDAHKHEDVCAMCGKFCAVKML